MQALDEKAIKGYGIPSVCLMENAGAGAARFIAQTIHKNTSGSPLVTVICGPGNNGGDGFVAARHLINQYINVQIFVIGARSKLKGDALINYQVLQKMKAGIHHVRILTEDAVHAIQKSVCVVDAIFGFGLNRTVEGVYQLIIEAINENAKRVFALDIPSGMDGTTGKIYGVCVRADYTLTFSALKKGFQSKTARQFTGKIILIDIGVPKGK